MHSLHWNVHDLRISWFARAWAIAVWFHLAAESLRPMSATSSLILTIFLAFSAVFVFLMPRNPKALLNLCVWVLLQAWVEAPVIGNHWVLAALVSMVFCLASFWRHSGKDKHGGDELVSAVRLTVLVAYSFAAFAKLNWDFLNPAVSCVVFYQDQLVRSWGLPQLSVIGLPEWGHVMAALTILTELSVAALLAFSRTRRIGLILAFGFHWLLALDLHQHFWDFSSVLFAGFWLFLDDSQIVWLQKQLEPLSRWEPKPVFVAALSGLVGAVVSVLNVLPRELGYGEILQQLGHQAWWLYGTAMVAVVVAAFFAPRVPSTTSRRIPALLLLPALLAGVNGLTPYLEIKTGFGWNMYSNLKTVAGETNHLLLPRTWDWTGAQRDLVYIVDSTDPELQRLHDWNYALTYSEFRKYAHRFPESAVTYRWRGEVHQVARLGDDHAGQGKVSLLDMKLLPFRVVDLQAMQRCQPNFSPAR